MKIATLCKALADPTRVRLLSLLLRHELTVGEVALALAASQPTVSRNLKILAEAGLVSTRREGSQTFCRARAKGPAAVFLKTVEELLGQETGLAASQNRAARLLARRQAETRSFFEAIAPQWPDLSRDVLGDLDLASELARRVPECGAAADLGCGPGDTLAALLPRAGQVIGVDNAPRMLALAARRLNGRPGVSLRLGELDHLPLRDQEVQAAVLSMVLHHLGDPAPALAEAARVLAPGGILVLADYDRHEVEDMRELHGDHRLGFAEEDLSALLSTAGFVVLSLDRFPVNKGLTVLVATSRRIEPLNNEEDI